MSSENVLRKLNSALSVWQILEGAKLSHVGHIPFRKVDQITPFLPAHSPSKHVGGQDRASQNSSILISRYMPRHIVSDDPNSCTCQTSSANTVVCSVVSSSLRSMGKGLV
jgi:hypothetical protein